MNVLLVNSNTVKPPLSPIGLLYLSAYLKAKGVPVEIADMGVQNMGLALEAAVRNPPGLVGISIRNIDSTQMKLPQYFLPDALAVVKAVQAWLPGVPVVLGGAGFSLAPLEIIKLAQADYGIVGEGEIALHELVARLDAGKNTDSIAGLVYRTPSGEYISNPPRHAGADLLRALPFQDISAVDYSYYYNSGGMASLQTKRGCALHCNYCTYPIIEGKCYRLLPPKRIVDEMEFLVSKGYDYLHFSDSIFNVPRKHALDVCEEMIRRRLPVKWHTYMSPQDFDEELADRLLKAGNDGILFGVDTCSETMLREMDKTFQKKDIERAASICHKIGMEFSLNILFGSPGETMETVEETLQAVDAWRPTAAFLTQGIRVYRDTPIYKRLVSEGRLDAGRSLLEPYFYLSEGLGDKFPGRIHEYAVARDFVFSDTTARSPSTDEAVVALYKRNFRGPCWKILRELKRVSAGML